MSFYEARNNVTVHEAEERAFKGSSKKINPKMRRTNIASIDGEVLDTEYGKNHVGSCASYELSHTESNFDVTIGIDSVSIWEKSYGFSPNHH